MANSNKQREKLIELLKELFQLDKPELDFGLYKIMHSKSDQISTFLDKELKEEIDNVFGDAGEQTAEQQLETVKQKVIDNLGEAAFGADGQLQDTYKESPLGKEYLAALEQVQSGGGILSDSAQVYDHLYRFFNRYYDNGDFMSMRYHVSENSSRAAPYAVPYDGREVYLHWANKDQYYIKTTESFNSYTFNLNEAVQNERQKQDKGELDLGDVTDLTVNFKLVDAEEGEHNNVKENTSRFFIIHDAEPVKLNEEGELEIQFQYRADPNKSGQDKKWQEKKIAEAVQCIVEALDKLEKAEGYKAGLTSLAPTDKQKDRTILAKYLLLYTARNTMDYFIHKDLGGFLQRELDFYIKNEIMRLDDVEQADAPAVEDWLLKIKVIRKIAKRIIDFLAQLEDFQKKLWLKKKFVVDTQYCITLDRLFPENQDWTGYTDDEKKRKTERLNQLLEEVAANEGQREEWVKLFAIGELKGDLATIAYSAPLTVEFLKANPFLVLDTCHFSEQFRENLVSELSDVDLSIEQILINSDNSNAIDFIRDKFFRKIKILHTDPPYNTGSDKFLYKDNYRHSSWAAMIAERLTKAYEILSDDGLISHYVDENEHVTASFILNNICGEKNRVGDIVWRNSSKNDQSYVSMQHEYILGGVKDKNKNKGEWTELKEGLTDIYAAFDKFYKKHGNDWKEIHKEALKWFKDIPDSNPIKDSKHYSWMDERGVYFPDNISGPNYGQYRYDVYHPITGKVCKEPASGWRYPQTTMEKRIDDGLVHFGIDETTVPNNKTYLKNTEYQSLTSIKYIDGRVASKNLAKMFGNKTFTNPKDVVLTCRLLKAYQVEDEIVLDIFSGTGTTNHALIELQRNDGINAKSISIEIGKYFSDILIPRIKKAIYSQNWKNGKPVSRDGISQCFKYIRLESYEDAINNLIVSEDETRNKTLSENSELNRDYHLHYLLESETAGSPSLLNINQFSDPTSYKLKIKQAGRDEYIEQNVDLVETFNWLIGLYVELLDKPRTYQAEFEREKDPDLPEDQNTRLKIKGRIKEVDGGNYWLRIVEGWVCRTPGDDSIKDKVLVVWRKLTDDEEKDAAVLENLLQRYKVNQADSEYDIIYVNGTHGLQLHGEAKTRLVSLEETFFSQMWAEADPGRVH